MRNILGNEKRPPERIVRRHDEIGPGKALENIAVLSAGIKLGPNNNTESDSKKTDKKPVGNDFPVLSPFFALDSSISKSVEFGVLFQNDPSSGSTGSYDIIYIYIFPVMAKGC